jgi:hypothetical protein
MEKKQAPETRELPFTLRMVIRSRSGAILDTFERKLTTTVPFDAPAGSKAVVSPSVDWRGARCTIEIPLPADAELLDGQRLIVTQDLTLKPTSIEERQVVRDDAGQIVASLVETYAT